MCFIVKVNDGNRIIKEITFKSEETFGDVRKKVEKNNLFMLLSFPNIMSNDEVYYYNLDFIYEYDKIVWNPIIDNINIGDFVNTYNLKAVDVYLVEKYIGDEIFIPIIKQTLTVVKAIVLYLWNYREEIGLIVDAATIMEFFVNRIKKINRSYDTVKAETFIYSIIIKDNWTLKELMKYHEIDDKELARDILLILGYKYNKTKKAYHITKKQKIIISNGIRRVVSNLENKFLN